MTQVRSLIYGKWPRHKLLHFIGYDRWKGHFTIVWLVGAPQRILWDRRLVPVFARYTCHISSRYIRTYHGTKWKGKAGSELYTRGLLRERSECQRNCVVYEGMRVQTI